MATTNKSKKSKRPDLRPARKRYWNSGILMKRKVAHLMKSGRFASTAEATAYWLSVRKRHYGPVTKKSAVA